MKVVIGVDVDPVLPAIMTSRPEGDVWSTLDSLHALLESARGALPRMTWLIRSDESVFFSTGEYASGYVTRKNLWDRLSADGHELGWHMHNLSMRDGMTRFDPDPSWLQTAFAALNNHFPVRATRTGWDYGSNAMMQRLNELGIKVDFSALPGNIVWQKAGPDECVVDWQRAPAAPYRPSRHDYQSSGPDTYDLIEIPITQFGRSTGELAKQVMGRALHGRISMLGITNKTRLMTQQWPTPPSIEGDVAAFFWHPEDLAGDGLMNLLANIQILRSDYSAEFITASEAAALYRDKAVGVR